MPLLLYTPFVDYIEVGGHWYLWLVPLAAGIAIVYKTLRIRNIRKLPAEAAGLTATILVGMVFAAAVLYLIYWGVGTLHR